MTMSPCRICGDPEKTEVVKYWCPDDGWIIGALCPHCLEAYGKCKPQKQLEPERKRMTDSELLRAFGCRWWQSTAAYWIGVIIFCMLVTTCGQLIGGHWAPGPYQPWH